jgi:hypothetical protein
MNNGQIKHTLRQKIYTLLKSLSRGDNTLTASIKHTRKLTMKKKVLSKAHSFSELETQSKSALNTSGAEAPDNGSIIYAAIAFSTI